jgi:hypothetical protein
MAYSANKRRALHSFLRISETLGDVRHWILRFCPCYRPPWMLASHKKEPCQSRIALLWKESRLSLYRGLFAVSCFHAQHWRNTCPKEVRESFCSILVWQVCSAGKAKCQNVRVDKKTTVTLTYLSKKPLGLKRWVVQLRKRRITATPRYHCRFLYIEERCKHLTQGVQYKESNTKKQRCNARHSAPLYRKEHSCFNRNRHIPLASNTSFGFRFLIVSSFAVVGAIVARPDALSLCDVLHAAWWHDDFCYVRVLQ